VACPSCRALVHADTLKGLAADAVQAERIDDLDGALVAWNMALGLLPPGSAQHQKVGEKIADLTARQQKATGKAGAPRTRKGGKRAGWLAGLGVAGVLLLLGKGKLLLLGLLKAKTMLSMLLSMGVYAAAWGWKFAAGLILSMYVHEMGHVTRLRRYGIPATAPMFVPGLGAYVRLKQSPRSPSEDARTGLAGPLWGAYAAMVALAFGLALRWPVLVAIASAGAWVNVFNLLPVWQLDGGRAWNALSRRQRAWSAALLWLMALMGADGLLYLLAIAGSVRALSGQAAKDGDQGAHWMYMGLALGLTTLMVFARNALPH
jgi:Zn-dependent protease